MIKIKVTDEMVSALKDVSSFTEDMYSSDWEEAVRAVLDIVQRDLNVTDNLVGRHAPGKYNQIVKGNGCIEVSW